MLNNILVVIDVLLLCCGQVPQSNRNCRVQMHDRPNTAEYRGQKSTRQMQALSTVDKQYKPLFASSYNKNLAIANTSRVCCTHNTLRAS